MSDIIFGYNFSNRHPDNLMLSYIILLGKYHVYCFRYDTYKPDINKFKELVTFYYNVEKYTYQQSDNLEMFKKKWHLLHEELS